MSSNDTQLFSYFTELKPAWPHGRTENLVAQTFMLSLIFLIAVSTNALLVVVLIKNARRLSPTACLVLHLALADLLFVSAVPTVTLGRWRRSWNFGVPVCKGVMYTLGLGISSMLYSLAAISVCRQLCVTRAPGHTWASFRFPGGATGLVVTVSMTIAVLSAAGAVPVAVYFQVVTVEFNNYTVDICTFVSPASVPYAWLAPLSTLAFLVPLLLMIINYCRIFKTVRQSRDRTWQNGVNLGVQTKHLRASRSLRKLLRSLMLLVTSFFIFWLPLFITAWLMYLDKAERSVTGRLSASGFTWVAILTFANTCVNPLLYGFTNRRIRAMLARSFPIDCCRPANRVDPAKGQGGSPSSERRRRRWKQDGSGQVRATVSYIENSNDDGSRVEET